MVVSDYRLVNNTSW